MKIKDILQRDPATHALVNQGQARIVNTRDARALEELRGELSTFVCEGQYAEGVQKIVRSFLDNLGKTNQRAAWVSGFFGSGKSHLLKMLCHLWQDTVFPDGATARSLVPTIPEELRALLRELDTAGKRSGGLVAAAGTLPSGTNENVRLTILGILLRGVGLPEQYPQARFCLWLKANGWFDRVKTNIESAGRDFDRELNNLYVSGPLARAILACDSKFAADEADARKQLRAQFPPQLTDITTEDFLRTAKDALKLAGRDGRLPCTLLVLDEAQQYIGDSNERSVFVMEVAEAVSKQFDCQVIVVAAGQSALDAPLLQKLMDRFTIRVPLSDAEVETVTRKVLLQKKPSAIADVRKLLDTHAGELSRQLQGTRIGETVEDRAVIVDDYPLLPVRRRFWEHCFRQIDLAGTSSQLRSQLRIIHDAVAKLSDKPLGAVLPADELYEAIAPEMVNTGVLLREINERVIQVGKTDGPLARRICGLVFLIGKLKPEGIADIGVRATKEHLADLLVDDLSADNGKLRGEVEKTLKDLADKGVVMLVGDEFRLQTREGTDWDREFRNRQTKLSADEKAIQFRRDQLLYAEADRIIRSLRLTQGASKESRQFAIHRDQIPPVPDGSTIPVWIRDQWSCAQKEVEAAARSAGIDSPTICVFMARQSADDLLRQRIVEADAAEQTLNAKGNPTTGEGQEARASMDGRRAKAAAERDRLAREIVANAKVFQGGGGEVMLATLEERVRAAAEASLIRLFPRFKDADSGAWEAVIKRARDGADHPFQPVGHTDATEKHAVCQQVNATIGSGKTGTDVRKALRASPYGWPQDAIDAALIALHRLQHLTATLNGVAVPLGQLDQNKISKAEFRVEQATITVQDRLTLRKLYSAAGVSCKSGEEAVKATEFLGKLIALGGAAGGSAPLPAAPSVTDIEDIQRLVGNAQLVAIKDKATGLEARIKVWQAASELAARRKPVWDTVERLARHAAGLDGVNPILDQVEAVREGRLLLEATDHVAPLRLALAKHLREAVDTAHAVHADAHNRAMAALAGNDGWRKLNAADQNAILTAVGLTTPTRQDVSTDENLIESLERRPSSTMRAEIDAIPGRVAQAIERAARLLEPKVRAVTIERSTLRSAKDVEAWLERQKSTLLAAINDGPVLIQ